MPFGGAGRSLSRYKYKRGLGDFIKALEKAGEISRIDAEVSSELEITEITDRISKSGGPALFFRKVAGSDYPLLINAMGSYKRMAMALGSEAADEEAGKAYLDSIAEDIEKYLELLNGLSILKIMKSLPLLYRLIHAVPVRKITIRKPVCRKVIITGGDVDLFSLPVLKCWPCDAGRFFTLPLVFTKYPDSKRQNAGIYRMQILDRNTAAMHWHKHKDGSGIFGEYARKGNIMPVSVALGCDPAVTYAATAPLPGKIDEMMLAGWLRKSSVRMVKCLTNEIYVPENAEFVIEGYVDPAGELAEEGPFGDHTGYYSLKDKYPVFHVTCITHKRDPVYPATVVGRPPMEDCYMAKATERIFLPFLKMRVPEIIDLNLPLEGVFHNCAIVSVRRAYPGAARKVMNAIWGMGQMMYTKMIVAVGEDVDVHKPGEVFDAVVKNVRGEGELVISEGPLDALDHSSDRALYGCRLGVDASGDNRDNICKEKGMKDEKDGKDGKDGQGGQDSTPGRSVPYRVIPVRKQAPGDGRAAIYASFADRKYKYRFVIAVDHDIDPGDISTIMWKVFNNIDAGRDLIIQEGRIGIDATKKWPGEGVSRGWPDEIKMSEDIKELVTSRWGEYGL